MSRLRATLAAHRRLLWHGSIDLPPGTDLRAARAVLVNADGVVVDTAMGAVISRGPRLPGRLRYRSDRALITLRHGRGGTYRVRVAVRDATLASTDSPVMSASLQVGTMPFTASLSCSPSRNGRRLVCRG